MNFMDIKTLDIANGPGCRVSLFVSGCRRHCKECFNPESWDFHHGEPFTEEVQKEIIKRLLPSWINGFTVLGGEPFEQENQKELLPFMKNIRTAFPDLSIWMYSGFTIEELTKDSTSLEILKLIDVLVDGEFQIEKKDLKLQYCGSTNQRVIDVPASLICGTVVEFDKYNYHGSKKDSMNPMQAIIADTAARVRDPSMD